METSSRAQDKCEPLLVYQHKEKVVDYWQQQGRKLRVWTKHKRSVCMLCLCCADWEFRTSPHVYLLCLLCKNVSWSVNECCAINEYMEPWAVVLEISKNQFDVEPSFSKNQQTCWKFFTNLELVLNFLQRSMCNPKWVMDWVMSLSMLVIWHNSLNEKHWAYGVWDTKEHELWDSCTQQ
jgi:hypothetical protein